MRMTPKEAADYLKCSVAIVYALCKAKRLPHYRLGAGRGKILIATDDADLFLRGCRVGAAPTFVVRVPTPVTLKHLKL